MNWIDRFTFVVRSSITTLRERVEDPPRMLHQLLIDMEEEHARVRSAVAESIADEIQLAERVKQARLEKERWHERARQSLARGEEQASAEALEQKLRADARASDLEKEHHAQRAQVEKLRRSVKDLEDKIRQAKQKKTLLLARMQRADSEQKIRGVLAQADGMSAMSAFRRLEERVDRAEALSRAHDELDGKDSTAEELDRQFAEKEFDERLRKELLDLKAQMIGPSSDA